MSDLLAEIGKKAVPLLVSAGAFLTFVAVAGGAIVWFRFYTVGLPTEQALDALPRSELIVIGAAPLVLFGLLGLLAVIAAYLLDPGGRATGRTFGGLVVLFVVESSVVIYLARYETSTEEKLVAAAVLAGGLVAVFAISRLFWRQSDQPRLPLEGDPVAAGDAAAGADQPHRFRLTTEGRGLLGLTALAIAVLVGLAVSAWWATAAIVAAALVTLAVYRVADHTANRFSWFAVALFFSVPALGAAMFVLRMYYEPLVQPVAAIRTVDGNSEAYEGIYVTATDTHVVLASVATVGCEDDELRRGAGRLFRLARAELSAMELGPPQPVAGAGERARAIRRELVRRARLPTTTAAANAAAPPRRGRSPVPGSTTPGEPAIPLMTHAVRREPEIERYAPEQIQAGSKIRIFGTGFGERPGAVTVGSTPATIESWAETEIAAALRKDTRSGLVRVGCPEPGVVRVLR